MEGSQHHPGWSPDLEKAGYRSLSHYLGTFVTLKVLQTPGNGPDILCVAVASHEAFSLYGGVYAPGLQIMTVMESGAPRQDLNLRPPESESDALSS